MKQIDSSKKHKNLEGLLNTGQLMRTALISLAVGSATAFGCLYISSNIAEKDIITKATEVKNKYYSICSSVEPLYFEDISDSVKIGSYKSNVDKYLVSIDSLSREYSAIVSGDEYINGKSKQDAYLFIGMNAFFLGAGLMIASSLKYVSIRQEEDGLKSQQLEEK